MSGRVGVKSGTLLFFVFMAVATLVSVMYAPQARAATFDVTMTDDPAPDGCAPADCSLREAVIAANAASGPDEINLPAGTYDLAIVGAGENAAASGDLDISDELTINGAGAENTIVDANGIDRVFETFAQTEISGLTVTGGSTSNVGGGVRISAGNLSLDRAVLSGNEASVDGGAVATRGNALTVNDSTFAGNSTTSFNGGAIHGGGDVTITSSTFENNESGLRGGAIHHDAGALAITNSTFSGNASPDHGGAVAVEGPSTVSVELDSVTVTDNEANSDGRGGQSGGGIDREGNATVSVKNSIIADNTTPTGDAPDVSGVFDSQGHNLIGHGDGSTGFVDGQENDRVGTANSPVDPGLGPLADNGGPTDTHAVQTDSPALDKGNADLTEDQRGEARPFGFSDVQDAEGGNGSDIGSFELQNPGALQFSDMTYDVNEAAGTATITVTRQGGTDGEVTVDFATSNGTATSGSDYTTSSGTLTFAAGDDSETFTVPITDDSTDEPDETVNLTLSNPQGVATLGEPDEAVLTIEDNDEAQTPDPVDPNACTITGTPGNDILRGTPGRDVICGLGGNDIIHGLGGDDLLRGGAGNDSIYGRDGSDRIEGGTGNDEVRGGNGNDRIEGQDGKDALYGEAGNDTITGGAGNDVLRGGPGRDSLDGGPGRNSVKQ